MLQLKNTLLKCPRGSWFTHLFQKSLHQDPSRIPSVGHFEDPSSELSCEPSNVTRSCSTITRRWILYITENHKDSEVLCHSKMHIVGEWRVIIWNSLSKGM